MTNGDDIICSTIALRVARYPKRKIALKFLLEVLERGSEPKANFIQALYVLGDSAAVPELHALHDRLAGEILEKKDQIDRWTVIDFLVCCEALGHLEGAEAYKDEIRKFLQHSDVGIRSRAEMALAGPQPEEFH
jgi:HEAT repeat protein